MLSEMTSPVPEICVALRVELRCSCCIYNWRGGARQQEYSERTRRKSKHVSTFGETCSNLVSQSLFSLRTERISKRRKRQTDRKDEADIVERASVLLRSLSVEKFDRFVCQNIKTLML